MLPLIIATLAPIVNSIQLLPQLYKTYTTRSVTDLSFQSLLLILFTNILWLLHGFFISNIPLILASVLSIIINLSLFTLFLRYINN